MCWRKSIIILFILALVPVPETASRVPKKARSKPAIEVPRRMQPVEIVSHAADSLIALSAYDKQLSSPVETFMVKNLSARELAEIWLTISYTTLRDTTPFHSRSEDVTIAIPPGESRLVSIRTFDRQHSFVYYKSRQPRSMEGVFPFKVSVTVDSVALLK